MGLLARTPDVRADKVAELKARIQSGNYDFSGESIAQAILSGRNQDVDF
jgi:anti-sigma28 factor (negative regulator of flagellin synthesis)